MHIYFAVPRYRLKSADMNAPAKKKTGRSVAGCFEVTATEVTCDLFITVSNFPQ